MIRCMFIVIHFIRLGSAATVSKEVRDLVALEKLHGKVHGWSPAVGMYFSHTVIGFSRQCSRNLPPSVSEFINK
jgi:hypothetical protein